MDSEALIRAFLAGDAAAIEKVRLWVQRSLAGFRRKLGTELEDAVQEILIELIRVFEAGSFAGTGALEAFVSRIARRRAIDRLRRQHHDRKVDLEPLAPWLDDPEKLERLRSVESTAGLLQLWNAMPASCRQLWRLIAQGYGYREMGTLFSVAPGTLRVRVKRCREKAFAYRQRLSRVPLDASPSPKAVNDVTASASTTTGKEESAP